MSNDVKFEKVKSDTPNNIKILKSSSELIEANIYATSVGRVALGALLMYGLGFAGFFGGAVMGLAIFGESFLGIVGTAIAGLILGLYIPKKLMVSKKKMIITPDAISIGDKNYRRSLWGGFSPGVERGIPNTPQLSIIDLDFSYGGTKERTGLSVESLSSEGKSSYEIINYLNGMVDSIPMKGEKPASASETGKREQAF